MSGLEREVAGIRFQNPVLLAAGTCGFGRELAEVVDLEALGGLVTKSVTLEPRWGNPPPRVTESAGAMLNSVGLANPGARKVREEILPWLADHLRSPRVLVSVAGHAPEEYFRVVEILEGGRGFQAFELNLSCPNDRRLGGLPFALDPDALTEVTRGVLELTDRPVLVKLAPNDPDPARTAGAAREAGASALTLVNTLPALELDPVSGSPRLGAGAGGMSGPSLRPVGLAAVRRVREATDLPLVGVGGILTAADAVTYLRAGASLVQIGTASFADPRAAERVVKGLHSDSWREIAAGTERSRTPVSAGRPQPEGARPPEGPDARPGGILHTPGNANA